MNLVTFGFVQKLKCIAMFSLLVIMLNTFCYGATIDTIPPRGRIEIVDAKREGNNSYVTSNEIEVNIYATDDMCADEEIKYYISTSQISDAQALDEDLWKTYSAGAKETITLTNTSNTIYAAFKDSTGNTSVIYSGEGAEYTVVYDANDGSSSGGSSAQLLADVVEIGDLVDYTPITANSTYQTNPAGYSNLYTGVESKELIREENIDWTVIKINEETGEVLISPTDAVNIGEVVFCGGVGFLNFENILDDICAKLYSNTNLGVTARSLNAKDYGCELYDGEIRKAVYPYGTPAEHLIDKVYNGVTYEAIKHTMPEDINNYGSFWEYDHIYNENQKGTYSVVDGNSTYTMNMLAQ